MNPPTATKCRWLTRTASNARVKSRSLVRARRKAEAYAKNFWERCGTDFAATETEFVGYNAFHRSMTHQDDGNEVILRLGVRDNDKDKLRHFSKLIPALILGGPPGVCILGGVPKPQEIISYWPALMPKSTIEPIVARYHGGYTDGHHVSSTETGNFEAKPGKSDKAVKAARPIEAALADGAKGTPLSAIALARSGDKGDTSNIGVMARSPKAYEFLCQYLTAQRVKDWFQELCLGPVTRHRVDSMGGLNFLLENALGGGGTMTLRADAQGKMFAQAVMRQKVDIPADVLADVKAAVGQYP